jgi:L-ascorbate metabolism protein UlaG (beta-lactamase superfamily)
LAAREAHGQVRNWDIRSAHAENARSGGVESGRKAEIGLCPGQRAVPPRDPRLVMEQPMKLTWLGHSAFRLETGSSVILIDPFLRGNPKFQLDFDTVTAGATHILLTHGHDDHVGDSLEIAKASGAQIVSNFEICVYLSGLGAPNINPGNMGGTIALDDFEVSFTPALHSSSTIVDGKPIYLGNPMGLVVTPASGPAVYHMGDTAIFPDMALIGEIYRPKIGLVPVGDRFTMGGQIAAEAVRRYFAFESVIPCHYGTFGLLAQTPDEFVAALGGKPKVHVPAIGAALDF